MLVMIVFEMYLKLDNEHKLRNLPKADSDVQNQNRITLLGLLQWEIQSNCNTEAVNITKTNCAITLM